jgi:hypothetical protein
MRYDKGRLGVGFSLAALLLLASAGLLIANWGAIPDQSPRALLIAEPPRSTAEEQLSPTRMPVLPAVTATLVVTVDTSQPAATPVHRAATPAATAEQPRPALYQPYQRFGVGMPSPTLGHYDLSQLHAGWYLTWSAIQAPDPPRGSEFTQMIRVSEDAYSPGQDVLEVILASNPVSLWLTGTSPIASGRTVSRPTGTPRSTTNSITFSSSAI